MRTGFGIPQLIMTYVHGIDRVNRGLMAPQELTASLLSAAITNMSPGNFPVYNFKDAPYEYLVQTLSPTIVKPFVEVATNKPYYGGTLVYPQASDKLKSDSGGSRASRVYHQIAKQIYEQHPQERDPPAISRELFFHNRTHQQLQEFFFHSN